jgi:hypothetical protein
VHAVGAFARTSWWSPLLPFVVSAQLLALLLLKLLTDFWEAVLCIIALGTAHVQVPSV